MLTSSWKMIPSPTSSPERKTLAAKRISNPSLPEKPPTPGKKVLGKVLAPPKKDSPTNALPPINPNRHSATNAHLRIKQPLKERKKSAAKPPSQTRKIPAKKDSLPTKISN